MIFTTVYPTWGTKKVQFVAPYMPGGGRRRDVKVSTTKITRHTMYATTDIEPTTPPIKASMPSTRSLASSDALKGKQGEQQAGG